MIKIPCMLGCIKPLIECWCWSCCCCNWCWNCCCCCWRFCMCIWFKSIPCWVPDPLRFYFEIFFCLFGKYKILTEKNQENVQFSESFYNFSYDFFIFFINKYQPRLWKSWIEARWISNIWLRIYNWMGLFQSQYFFQQALPKNVIFDVFFFKKWEFFVKVSLVSDPERTELQCLTSGTKNEFQFRWLNITLLR